MAVHVMYDFQNVNELPRFLSQISLSTTFAQTSVGSPVGLYEYTRSANPNRLVAPSEAASEFSVSFFFPPLFPFTPVTSHTK